jgi:photosystem II stability/assembly factor-like uncharacterized protein
MSVWLPVRPGRLAACAIVVALSLSSCGGGSGADDTFQGIPGQDPGPIHVHGLGVNPDDGALYIATHTGLFRTGEGQRRAERVGESQQDTMGFTVVGPDDFLGSGHPDVKGLQAGDPPLLGLIESHDAGETWQPISLRGEADFHVLRFLGERVYGYDASINRLLVSSDHGQTWDERATPGGLVDLVADPRQNGHLLASTSGDLLPGGESGLHASDDDGRTWRPIGSSIGLFAWPTLGGLYQVDGSGVVSLSGDRGASWVRVGEIGGQPAAFVAENPGELYVALHDGTIKLSTDGGETWALRSAP